MESMLTSFDIVEDEASRVHSSATIGAPGISGLSISTLSRRGRRRRPGVPLGVAANGSAAGSVSTITARVYEGLIRET